jgi:ferredoxin
LRFCPEKAFRRDLCLRCGECSLICPTGAIRGGKGRLPAFRPARCISCAHCAGICPASAYGAGDADGEGPVCSPEEFIRLCGGRRSIRRFERRVITDEEISKLLGPVGYSPTGTNACGTRVIAVAGDEVRSFLFDPLRAWISILWKIGLLRLAGALTGAGEMLRRVVGGEDLVFRDAPLVLFFFVPRRNPTARSDGVIAATLVMMNAETMGLGTFWNGVAERIYPLLRRWRLRGGRGCLLAAVLCAGHPAVRLRTLPPREWFLGRIGSAGERSGS